MNRNYIIGAALILAAGTFVAWRVIAGHNAEAAAHVAVLRDRSGSDAAGCDAVRSIVRGAFSLPGMGQNSTLTLFATGDWSNNNQAKLITTVRVPFTRRILEGREEVEHQKLELVDDITRDCNSLSGGKTSPIYSAVRNALLYLDGLRCERANCFVFAETDGADNVEPRLRAALAGSTRDAQALRGTLANAGIRVTLCGFAQTRAVGARKVPEELWKSLFTAPDLVEVLPFCVPSATVPIAPRG